MHIHIRSRSLLWAVPILVAVLVSSVNAQGLFGAGLPGLPSFGGNMGGASGCGEKLCPSNNLEAYVGWMEDRDGTAINVDTRGRGILGITSVHNRYTNRGLWLGLMDTVCLSGGESSGCCKKACPQLCFIASGWYLVPSKTTSREEDPIVPSDDDPLLERTWDVDPQWWYADGIFAWTPCGGFTLLAGLRYDYYTVRFKHPRQISTGLLGGNADVTSEGWIPLLGTQYALSSSAGNLVVRAVGVPTLLGNVKYGETVLGLDRVEAKGTYNNGWFLEVFAEYSKCFGPGSVGVFGRWNGTQGNSNVHLAIAPIPGEETFKATLHRNSWTFGASFSLNFNLPM